MSSSADRPSKKRRTTTAAPQTGPTTAVTQVQLFGAELVANRELRQRLLRFLPGDDLARLMRVKESFQEDAASLLYASVGYDQVRLRMSSSSTPRQKMYCYCVRNIDATTMTLSPTVISQLNIRNLPESGSGRKRRIAQWLRTNFRSQLINIIVPQLLFKCPGLQSIQFGNKYEAFGSPSWTVYFRPATDTRWDEPGTPVTAKWHIVYVSTIKFDISLPLPSLTTFPNPKAPSTAYAIRPRFDLVLTSGGPAIHEDWQTYVGRRGLTCFSDVFGAINLGNLPVDVDTLSFLYVFQKYAGHKKLLHDITADRVKSYSSSDFRLLALIASSSLTHLSLVDRYDSSRASIDFAELPELINTIRCRLPNLKVLRIALRGIAGAEDSLKQKLRNGKLSSSRPGPIVKLSIFTEPYSGRRFNIIRLLYKACAQGAEIAIGDSVGGEWSWSQQTALLAYLRSRPATQRYYLAAADLVSMGITTPQQVYELEYHRSGRPISPAARLTAEWLAQAKASAMLATSTIISGVQEATSQLARAAAALASKSVEKDDISAETAALLEAVKAFGPISTQIGAIADQAKGMQDGIAHCQGLMQAGREV